MTLKQLLTGTAAAVAATALVGVAALALVVFLASPANAASPKASTVHIEMSLGGSCGATVVAPHVILTAAHCVTEETGDVVKIDDTAVKTLEVVIDTKDHALVRVDKRLPNPPARWERNEQFRQGYEVDFWGWPGPAVDLYRTGYMYGTCDAALCVPGEGWEGLVYLFSTPVWYGDSGSGVFNKRGELVGVVSVYVRVSPTFLPMGILPMAFTDEQVEGILG